jgi:hypothetical protein
MPMYCLSVRNPLSYLICAGVKDVENRTWTTKYRGRLLIHSSGQWPHYCVDERELPIGYRDARECGGRGKEFTAMNRLTAALDKYYGCKSAQEFYALMEDRKKLKTIPPYLQNMAIIGEVTLSDIKTNARSYFAEPGCYHWILTKPVLYAYDKVIHPVRGKLGLWKYQLEV